MPDLQVDLDMLRNISAELASIGGDFEEVGAVADRARDVVHESHLSSAMQDFANDWKVHREHLLESMKAVQQMATHAVDTYQQADSALATALLQSEQRVTQRIPGRAR